MRVVLRVLAVLLLVWSASPEARAQSNELGSEGIKAFVEACVRTTPDFRKSAAAFDRRSPPTLSMTDLERGRATASAPSLLAILGPHADKSIRDARVCGVVIKGNFDRAAAATIEKYIGEPSFPYKARLDGPTTLDDGMQASVFAAFPYGRNNLYAVIVTRGAAFEGYGRATMLLAMSGKIDLR